MEKYSENVLAQYRVVAEEDLEDVDGPEEDEMDVEEGVGASGSSDSEEELEVNQMYAREDEEFDDDGLEYVDSADEYEMQGNSKRRKLAGGRRFAS